MRKEYFEALAKQVLLHASPEKYKYSKLKDKPDIQNEKLAIGVEVTLAMSESFMHGYSKFSRMKDRTYENQSVVKKENMEHKSSVVMTEEDQRLMAAMTDAIWGSLNDTKKAYRAKLKKLNGDGYTIFPENNLFIIAEFEEEHEIVDLVDFIKRKRKSAREFQYIYVYTGSELYTIQMKDHTYTKLPIPPAVAKHLRDRAQAIAREMVQEQRDG